MAQYLEFKLQRKERLSCRIKELLPTKEVSVKRGFDNNKNQIRSRKLIFQWYREAQGPEVGKDLGQVIQDTEVQFIHLLCNKLFRLSSGKIEICFRHSVKMIHLKLRPPDTCVTLAEQYPIELKLTPHVSNAFNPNGLEMINHILRITVLCETT